MIVPTIVLAELMTISERKRPDISMTAVLERIDHLPTFSVAPLDLTVIHEMLRLPASLELHDRAIAATARAYGSRLITRDPALAQVVEVVW